MKTGRLPQGSHPPGHHGLQHPGMLGTHCGWPQWACRPPRCLVLSTIRPRCTAASAPAHSAACCGAPPLPRPQTGRGQGECTKALSSHSLARAPRYPRAMPRLRWARSQPLAPTTPPFVSDFSLQPTAYLPSPTQHQAQLVLIRAGGVEGGSFCYSSRLGGSAAPTSPDTRRFLGCVGLLLTPEHLPLPL